MRRHTSACHHGTLYRTIDDSIRRQFHQSIVDQYFGPGPNVPGQRLIGDRNILHRTRGEHRPGADLPAGSQGHCLEPNALTGDELQRAVDFADANARPLQVLNDRDGHPMAIGRVANRLDRPPMRVVRTVGKIQTGRIHAASNELVEHDGAIARRTDGADDFRFSHGAVLLP